MPLPSVQPRMRPFILCIEDNETYLRLRKAVLEEAGRRLGAQLGHPIHVGEQLDRRPARQVAALAGDNHDGDHHNSEDQEEIAHLVSHFLDMLAARFLEQSAGLAVVELRVCRLDGDEGFLRAGRIADPEARRKLMRSSSTRLSTSARRRGHTTSSSW